MGAGITSGGCCDCGSGPPCSHSGLGFTVRYQDPCTGNYTDTSDAVVSLSYGSTTITLTSPTSTPATNSGQGTQYRFIPPVGSEWSGGTTATITFTSDNWVTAVRSVTLGCGSTGIGTVILTRSHIQVGAVGTCCATVWASTSVTIFDGDEPLGSITTPSGDGPTPLYAHFELTEEHPFATCLFQWSDDCGTHRSYAGSFCVVLAHQVCDHYCGCPDATI